MAPAIEEAREGGESPKFEMLQHDTEYLAREPTGVGLDVPMWLVALEEEVEDVLHADSQGCPEEDLAAAIPPALLTYEQAMEQLDRWTRRKDSAG